MMFDRAKVPGGREGGSQEEEITIKSIRGTVPCKGPEWSFLSPTFFIVNGETEAQQGRVGGPGPHAAGLLKEIRSLKYQNKSFPPPTFLLQCPQKATPFNILFWKTNHLML